MASHPGAYFSWSGAGVLRNRGCSADYLLRRASRCCNGGLDEGRRRVQVRELHERHRHLLRRVGDVRQHERSHGLFLASGQTILIQSGVATDILVQLVFNWKSTGPTVSSFTTYGNDSMYDKVTSHVGHVILGHLDVRLSMCCNLPAGS